MASKKTGNPVGRPQNISDEELIKGVDSYIASTDIPILKEYAIKMGISSNRLFERGQANPELSNALKKILDNKEVVLEKGMLSGTFNPTASIFSLKQLGWRDKIENEVTIPEIKVTWESEDYAD